MSQHKDDLNHSASLTGFKDVNCGRAFSLDDGDVLGGIAEGADHVDDEEAATSRRRR